MAESNLLKIYERLLERIESLESNGNSWRNDPSASAEHWSLNYILTGDIEDDRI